MNRNWEPIKAICDKATPGPWECNTNRHPECGGSPWGWFSHKLGQFGTWSGSRNRNYENDNRFLVTARTALPEAITEIEQLRSQLEKERKDKRRG